MHIENFKVFCDLVETQSFSKAAKINNVTQSAVSQQLRTMERHFKVLIVDRSQKQFRLTSEGEKIFNAYTQILTTYDQLENDLLGMKKILSGDIHIATVYSIGLHELPPYIKLFLSEFPEVNLKVEYRRSNLVYDDVEQNLVDIGLVAFKTDNKNLEFIPFKDDRLILVCSPKHPLARKGEIDIKELDSENFIAYEPDIPTRKASDDLFKKHKISVNTIKEYDNTETVKNSVEINAGVALLPETSVQQELRQRSLIKINMTGIEITRPLFIVHKKGKVLSPARLKFIDLLTTKLDD